MKKKIENEVVNDRTTESSSETEAIKIVKEEVKTVIESPILSDTEKTETVKEIKEEAKTEVKELQTVVETLKDELKNKPSKTDSKNSDMDTIIWIVVAIILLVAAYMLYKHFTNEKNIRTEIESD